MATINQTVTDKYALYHGDSCEVLPTLPDESIHLSVYSPPFCGLYNYSSSERDLSNCRNYDEFFDHYAFIVSEIYRTTKPGRITAVHCMDVPFSCNAGSGLTDFPGDIIRLHQKLGFIFQCRHHVWKEPLGVRLRTMAKGLAHKQIVDDSSLCDSAGADQLIIFRKKGENETPITHPTGLHSYAGSRQMPNDILQWKGHDGKQTENRYSHWIWRNYASAFWDDIRIGRVLPYKESKEQDDEKHVHPLQLDVIERCVILRSNPGEVVLTPFMGVGSECYGSVINGRKAIGIELKKTYYDQACLNMEAAAHYKAEDELFGCMETL
jgi:DNA modification methylase